MLRVQVSRVCFVRGRKAMPLNRKRMCMDGEKEPYQYMDKHHMQKDYKEQLDTKMNMIIKEIDLLKDEEVSMYSMDALEELMAALHDLKQRRDGGHPHLLSVDETEPEYEQSKEYDV